MRLFTRSNPLALAAVTAAALMVPVTVGPASASAAPVAAATPAVAPTVVPAAKQRTKKSSRSARSFAARARVVMSTGNRLKGTPYRHAGSTPRGFDCSGFTMYVYRKAGKNLPHTATGQMHRATRVSAKNVRVGDLVFFRSGSRAYHVGIYAGKHRVLHAPRPGRSVTTSRIWTSNVSYGRVL